MIFKMFDESVLKLNGRKLLLQHSNIIIVGFIHWKTQQHQISSQFFFLTSQTMPHPRSKSALNTPPKKLSYYNREYILAMKNGVRLQIVQMGIQLCQVFAWRQISPQPPAFSCWNLGLNLSYSRSREFCSKIGNTPDFLLLHHPHHQTFLRS